MQATLAACQIYNSHGKDAFLRLWDSLHSQKKMTDDIEFAGILGVEVDKS